MAIKRFTGQYRFLSNFFPCNIEYEGVKHRNTETAYQAAKFADLKEKKKIADMTAGESKGYAKGKQPQDWHTRSIGIMEELVRQKFTKNKHLKEQLLMTKDEELIEGNNWGDKFWGMVGNTGENHLGKILMRVRAELKQEKGA